MPRYKSVVVGAFKRRRAANHQRHRVSSRPEAAKGLADTHGAAAAWNAKAVSASVSDPRRIRTLHPSTCAAGWALEVAEWAPKAPEAMNAGGRAMLWRSAALEGACMWFRMPPPQMSPLRERGELWSAEGGALEPCLPGHRPVLKGGIGGAWGVGGYNRNKVG